MVNIKTLSPEMSLIDILHLYHLQGASGTLLAVDHEPDEIGWITFEKGEIINSGIGSHGDQRALVKIFAKSTMTFDYLNKVVYPERTILKRFEHLMLETTVQVDGNALPHFL